MKNLGAVSVVIHRGTVLYPGEVYPLACPLKNIRNIDLETCAVFFVDITVPLITVLPHGRCPSIRGARLVPNGKVIRRAVVIIDLGKIILAIKSKRGTKSSNWRVIRQ